jgi:hypothetical protein
MAATHARVPTDSRVKIVILVCGNLFVFIFPFPQKIFHHSYSQQQKELPCERNVDQCKNNGMCTDDNTGGSTCTCVNGYTGATCETG